MTGRRWLAVSLGGVALVAAVVSSLAATSSSRSSQSAQLLPDLVIDAPSDLSIAGSGPGGTAPYLLSFTSRAGNVGKGPLVITGARSSADAEEMVASQVIRLADSSSSTVPGGGSLRYVTDFTHQHWHLLPFMQYELRTQEGTLVAPDGKTGFCLGDRYNLDPDTKSRAEPAGKVFNTNCGPGETGLLTIEEGISPGWGDNYEPWRDGQAINLAGVPAGRYLLVHRVNASRRLRESNYRNNASSVVLKLSWPAGGQQKPRVKIVAVCPGSARCVAPG